MPSAFRHDPCPALLHTGSQGNLLECEPGRAAFRRSPSQGAGLPRHGLQAPGLASPQPPAGPAITGAGPCSARPGSLHTSAGASSGPQSLRHSLSGPWGKIPTTPPWRGHPAWLTTGTCGTRGEQTGTQPSVTGPRAGPRGTHPRMGAKGLWSRLDRGGGHLEGSRAGSPNSPTQGGRPALPCGLLGVEPTPGWTPLALLSSGGRPRPSHQHDPPAPRPPDSVSPPGSSSEHSRGGGRQPGLCTQRLQHAGQQEDGLGPRLGERSWNHQPFLQQKPRLHAPILTGLTGRASTPLTP